VVKVERSYTGQFLKELLERRPGGRRRQAEAAE
jgi:excinuclease ABC subunit A